MAILAATVSASRAAVSTYLAELGSALRMFSLRGWLVGAIGAAATLVLIGVPTAIIDTPFFIRMIPVRPQDYAIWIATGLLVGLIAGTFAVPSTSENEGKVISGGFLSYLAVGCPICNKLVVLLLGASGALSYFGPLQLYIGVASLLLLTWTLRLRVRSLVGASCPMPEPRA